jgi:hypothetical protein
MNQITFHVSHCHSGTSTLCGGKCGNVCGTLHPRSLDAVMMKAHRLFHLHVCPLLSDTRLSMLERRRKEMHMKM